MKTDREVWLDKCKGVAIILVVFGHVLVQDFRNESIVAMFVYNIIYFFHNRLFFVLSGYAFFKYFKKEKKFKRFVLDKIKRLIFPYLIYSIAVFLIFFLLSISLENRAGGLIHFKLSIYELVKGIITGNNPWCIHIWYLYVLFILSILGYIIAHCNRTINIIVILIFSALFCITYYRPFGTFVINLTLNYGIYFLVGGVLANFKSRQKDYHFNSSVLWHFISIISIAFMVLRAVLISMSIDYPLVNTNAIATLLFSIVICLNIIDLSKRGNKHLDLPLSYIGANSLVIYLLHQPFIISATCTLIWKFGPRFMWIAVCFLPFLGIIIPLWLKKIYIRLRG